MASLWKQHKLLQSFNDYFYSPKLSIPWKIRDDDSPGHRELMEVLKDAELKRFGEMHVASRDRKIKKDDLIRFHFLHGLSWYQFFKRQKRQKLLREDALKCLRAMEEVKDTISSCVLNGHLVSVGGDELVLSGKGDRLRGFWGWIDECLKVYGTLRVVLLAILSTFSTLFSGALIYKVLKFIYHRFF